MKKFISIILALTVALSVASCGKKDDKDVTTDPTTEVTAEPTEEAAAEATPEATEGATQAPTAVATQPAKQPATQKPSTVAPAVKPVTQTPSTVTPTQKPATQTPATVAPTQKPATQEPKKSVGNTLLSAFKSNSGSGALATAEKLVQNPVIQFSGAASPVEPGYLTGFGNTQITGFKEGAMFGPMIGTIPFIGYVFTLEDSANVSAFISTLKSAADRRWNICTEADEVVTGSVGNKVFFVMSPISFEE